MWLNLVCKSGHMMRCGQKWMQEEIADDEIFVSQCWFVQQRVSIALSVYASYCSIHFSSFPGICLSTRSHIRHQSWCKLCLTFSTDCHHLFVFVCVYVHRRFFSSPLTCKLSAWKVTPHPQNSDACESLT